MFSSFRTAKLNLKLMIFAWVTHELAFEFAASSTLTQNQGLGKRDFFKDIRVASLETGLQINVTNMNCNVLNETMSKCFSVALLYYLVFFTISPDSIFTTEVKRMYENTVLADQNLYTLNELWFGIPLN